MNKVEKVDHKVLGDMKEEDIVGFYQTTKLTHYDGHQRIIHYTDIETPFPKGEKIVSVTDVEGYITHANSTFVYMSGYSREELIGTPHYILRHPDMPRAAFKILWDTLEEKGRWKGYVKNLRKDGGYYWVYASVFSIFRNGELVGYTSSRHPTEPEQVAIHAKQYRQLLRQES